jgi:hypothetical protein
LDDVRRAAPAGYQFVTQIGRGASSVVWEARRMATGQSVAVKMLDADISDLDAVRRFERERDAMTALATHPNILTIVDAGLEGGRPWLAMELCRRGSLGAYIGTTGALDLPAGLSVLARLADALGAAHDRGVVHCDVKPANVMLTDSGEPTVGDFGIARVSVGRATTTTVGGFSLDHVAPELLDNGKRSPRSDVYSLGTTAWELLVGHPPFRQTDDVSVGAVLSRILRQPLPESPRIPGEVLELLRRMAAKDPEERPGSMAQVKAEAHELANRLGLDLDEAALPVVTAVEREMALVPLTDVDADLDAGSTRLRPGARRSPEAVHRPSVRTRGLPLAVAAVSVLVVGGGALGLYGLMGGAWATVHEPIPVASAVGPRTAEQAEAGLASDQPPSPSAAATPAAGAVGPPPVPAVQRPRAVSVPAAAAPVPPVPPPAAVTPTTSDPVQPQPVVSSPIISTPPKPISKPKPKTRSADINGDGTVNCADKEILLSQWGESGDDLSGDLNGDGTVQVTDLSMLLSKWNSGESSSEGAGKSC